MLPSETALTTSKARHIRRAKVGVVAIAELALIGLLISGRGQIRCRTPHTGEGATILCEAKGGTGTSEPRAKSSLVAHWLAALCWLNAVPMYRYRGQRRREKHTPTSRNPQKRRRDRWIPTGPPQVSLGPAPPSSSYSHPDPLESPGDATVGLL